MDGHCQKSHNGVDACPVSAPRPSPPPMLSALGECYGSSVVNHIQTNCKILVVGAGGIGCELIKNLALCGFRDVTAIDLDTIDVSNLNRQLLFRYNHVGKPKSTVACQVAVESLVPSTCDSEPQKQETTDTSSCSSPYHYRPLHGNVCDNSLFNVPFVSQFDLVLNALDNVTARRRVNRLCLAAKDGAGVPMIEAGTTGYLGQTTVVTPTVQCYECRPQEPPKVYPICTIRSTPTLPVHTIVWAKELYKLLFCPKVEESMLYEAVDGEGSEVETHRDTPGKEVVEREKGNEEGVGDGLGYEPSVYMQSVLDYRGALAMAMGKPTAISKDDDVEEEDIEVGNRKSETNGSSNGKSVEALARQVLTCLYKDEIQKQLDMGRYKAARKTPSPLKVEELLVLETNDVNMNGVAKNYINGSIPSTTRHDQVWTQHQCAHEFIRCLVEAVTVHAKSGGSGVQVLPEFDKDDPLGMRFVTAASNLRSYAFGIEPIQSYYSAKGIAGNIIPAIATTNAIVAGLQVLQAFHILKGQVERGLSANDAELVQDCRYVNCVRQPSRNGLFLIASKLEPPNPGCYVCRSAIVHVTLNVSSWTLQDWLDKVLKADLGFLEPALLIEGNVVYEEGEEDYVPNLSKKLQDLPRGGIKHGTVLLVEDYSQDMSVEIVVSHCEVWPKKTSAGGHGEDDDPDAGEDNPFRFMIGGIKPAASAVAASARNGEENQGDEDDDDDIIEVSEDPDVVGRDAKRPAESLDQKPASKKRKIQSHNVPADGNVIEID